MWSIDDLQAVWQLASRLHKGQQYGTEVEYLNHIGSVTFEVLRAIQEENIDADLAIKCAVLHDTVEDTSITQDEIRYLFGDQVAAGVAALTKDTSLPDKQSSMLDSLRRIKQQPQAVWAVKMADRICNLQPPPVHWNREKKRSYLTEAKLIHAELKAGNAYLAQRLLSKIDAYQKYL